MSQKENIEIKNPVILFVSLEDRRELNQHLRLAEVLQGLGYPLAIEDAADYIPGINLPEFRKVTVEESEHPRIRKIVNIYDRSPFAPLFFWMLRGEERVIDDLLKQEEFVSFNLMGYQPIPDSWVNNNVDLVMRAWRTAMIIEAEEFEWIGAQYAKQGVETAQTLWARQLKARAAFINYPTLDSQTIKQHVGLKVIEILEQHPELRPYVDSGQARMTRENQ